MLAAWGITTDDKPAFIGLATGTGESFDAWHDFLAGLHDRGLASPLLIISDGAAGLIGAIEGTERGLTVRPDESRTGWQLALLLCELMPQVRHPVLTSGLSR